MKINIHFTAKKRESFGTSISRNLRAKNQIPAIIYGEKKNNDHIVLNENEISKVFKYEYIFSSLMNINLDGKDQTVIIKNIQRHQYKNKILHIDFQRVTEDSNISTKIPINYLNKKQCVGVKYGGKINIKMVDVKIICKSKDLPKCLNIDLSKLEMNHNLHLSDIKEKNNIIFLDQKKGFDRIVVSVKKPKQSTDKKDMNDESTPKPDQIENNENKK